MNILDFDLAGPKTVNAKSLEEALHAANQIHYPVVLKINSEEILHKTDVGGVRTGILNDDELKTAFREILENVNRSCPQARIDGIIVQETVQEGIEIIVGLIQDPQFGLSIMFGLGGIFAEILKDVTFRILPINAADARSMIREIKGYEVLNGYRNTQKVSEDMLVDLLLKVSKKGYELRNSLEAVDLNPIMVWGDQYRVLDGKFILKDDSEVEDLPLIPNTSHLNKFFDAESIALIGASETEGKVGYGVLDSLINHDYQGVVFPVNPKHTTVMGLKAYPSLAEIKDPIDMAVMTTDISFIPGILEDCEKKNIKNLVIISGGGKELGGDNSRLEDEIRKTSMNKGIRIIGPNCTGVFSGKSQLATFFQTQERMSRPKDGPVAFMSQSGTVGIAFLEDALAFGVRHYVSYGNRVDVDEADLLEFWGDDQNVKVIGMYVEGFENGRKFLQVAKRVSKIKPVVIYKSARTEHGAKASASHTGNLGGKYQVVKGALSQAGLITVDSYDELLSSIKAIALQPEAKGKRVGMISNGAGSMIQAIDYLSELQIRLPSLEQNSLNYLDKQYPSYYVKGNPIDVTGSGTSDDYLTGIRTLLDDPNIDIVMPWFVFVNNPLQEDLITKMGELSGNNQKPILISAFGGEYSKMMMSKIESLGFPVYQSVCDWVSAAKAISWRCDRSV